MIFAIIGAGVLLISTIGGWLLASRNAPDQQRPMKILLFFLYFWLFTFAQLVILAIGYSVMAT